MKVEITLNNIYRTKVTATRCGDYLGVHRHGDKWRVSHVATGNMLSNHSDFETKKSAMAYGKHIQTLLDLSFISGKSFYEDRATVINAMEESLRIADENH